MRNIAVAGSALVAVGAIAAACTTGGSDSASRSSSLTFDPLPSQLPSGAAAVPGAPRVMTPSPPPPVATSRVTTFVVPPPSTVTVRPPAPVAPVVTNPPVTTTAPPATTSAPAPSPTTTSTSAAPASPKVLADGSVDCAQSKCIALTFSGGPGTETRQFLQILNEHGGNGTFFVTGAQVAQNADVLSAIVGTGNEVANGTWSQPNMTSLTAAEDLDQLTRTNDAIKAAVGVTPTLFRPMGGHTNAAVVGAGKQAGLSQVLWDLDTVDYNYQSDAAGLAKIIAGAKPGQVVMLHDTFPATATALDQALGELKTQGYAFVTVSQLYRSR